MKKIISLILVVLLCLPASFIAVSADGADTYTITAADGADTTSNDYLNIYKYLAYYDGSEELNIPAGYITVGQWKANIANPAINAGNLTDADYITDACTLTLTMDDGVTTKTVYINAVDYNYMFKEYDKKSTTTFASNDLGLAQGKGSKATVKVGNKEISNGEYALTMDVSVPSDATNMQGYVNILQNLSDINKMNLPYSVNMTFVPESSDSLWKFNVGFINTTNNGRAGKDLPASAATAFKTGDKFDVSIMVYPGAKVFDVYVNGSVVLENQTTEAPANQQGYADYNRLYFRFYNGTKVGDVYENLTFAVTDYNVRYGYGKVNDEIYVAPSVEITNYEDGAKIVSGDITAVEAVTNSDDYKTAALYIDGVKVDEVTMSGTTATLDASSMGYGDHTMEVRMYPETGEYISDSVTVSVLDLVDLSSYTITFSEFAADNPPTSLASQASYIGRTDFVNMSNPSPADSTVTANDALVEFYDDARGNVLHVEADPNSDTSKSGRRIEIYQSNTANNMAVNYDICYESFSGTSYTLHATRDTGEKKIVTIDAEGLLTMEGTVTSETKSIQLEAGKWYNIQFDANLTMGGQVALTVYDENGLVGSMESIIDATYTDRIRIYTPYNKDNLQSGEAYIDNIKITIVSSTGSIGEITASADDLNTVSAIMNGVSRIDSVEITNADGEVELLGYVYDAENSALTISTSRPLEVTDTYTLSVYADGFAVPMTSGFVLTGGYIKVTDSYFNYQRGSNYAVLNVVNTTGNDGTITVLVSEWDGDKIVSVKADTITVATGENKYNVKITGDVDNVKVMPVASFAKPILLSKDIITK